MSGTALADRATGLSADVKKDIEGKTGELKAKASAAAAPKDEVPSWLPRAALLMFAVFCSTNFTLVKVLEAGHSDVTVAAVRFGVALLPFLPLIPRYLDWTSIKSGVEIGMWCFLGYWSQAVGLQYTEANKGAFLCSLAMVVVPVLNSWMGKKVEPQLWGAVLLAMSGTALLVGVSDGGGAANVGDMLCGLTAVGFGFMFTRMDKHAEDKDFDPVGCTVWQVATIATAMAVWLVTSVGPAGAVQEVTSMLTSGPEVLATLAWVGIVTTAGVLYVETWAMERMPSTEAGVIFASEPVWASIFASFVLGETFGIREACGGLCILAACLLTQVRFDGDEGGEDEAKGSQPATSV